MWISRDVARRFLLGRQGLWPGRRWRGIRGTEQAMRTIEHLQLDPLQVIARAQDLALQSRVVDYHPDDWARLTYDKRRFFEWGGWLAVRPIDELRYYRVVMRRERSYGRMWPYMQEHGGAIDEVRQVLRERGEMTNRDFAMADRTRVDSYRGRKDSAIALYYLWRTGEAMVKRRSPTFERVYALSESVAPAAALEEATEAEADDFLLLKGVGAAGFSRLLSAKWTLERDISTAELQAWRERMLADGTLLELEIGGLSQRHVALGTDRPALEALAAGRVPRGWKPLEATTTEEATFLSPLDPVIADRNRTRALFDFDYKWEVYDKVEKRKFGYYVLPILWADRLVGRFDAKLERASMTLVILGLWLEDDAVADDAAFAAALRRGMRRFVTFLGASSLDARAVDPRLELSV
jgi:uncharacterized protein YcaQ